MVELGNPLRNRKGGAGNPPPKVGALQLYPDPTGKENSESILASTLADGIVRCRLKRRSRYQWAGLSSFEKPMDQDADSIPRGGRQHDSRVKREWLFGPA